MTATDGPVKDRAANLPAWSPYLELREDALLPFPIDCMTYCEADEGNNRIKLITIA